MSLTTLATAYPSIDPWFDLRPYLVNGWRSLGTQTCGLSATHNMLFWSMRIIADDAVSWTMLSNIPENLRPPQHLQVPVFTGDGATYVTVNRNSGQAFLSLDARDLLGGVTRAGEFVITGITPRGTAVT